MPLTELKQGHRLTYSGNSSWTLRMGTRSFLSWSQNGNQILWSWSQNGNQTFDLDLRIRTRLLSWSQNGDPVPLSLATNRTKIRGKGESHIHRATYSMSCSDGTITCRLRREEPSFTSTNTCIFCFRADFTQPCKTVVLQWQIPYLRVCHTSRKKIGLQRQ